VAFVSAGEGFCMAISKDGSLWAWGTNVCGQLGDGTMTQRLTPVKIMEGVVSVSAGHSHTLAIRNDRSLWAWGENFNGMLGDGTASAYSQEAGLTENHNKYEPIKIMDDVISISAGFAHSMAIKSDGSLWAWGTNDSGELGDGTKTHRLSPTKIADDVTAVSAGSSYSMFVKNDGSLWGCGLNYFSTLGDGTNTDRQNPVMIMDEVVAISAGSLHCLAIKTDGSLWAWGSNGKRMNGEGRLGDGTDSDRNVPTRIMDKVASISASAEHSMAIDFDGKIWAWGANGYGELGDGTTKTRHSPTGLFSNWIKVFLDEHLLVFDVPPQIINGRTLVPLRIIYEELGATIEWDNVTKTVTAINDNTKIVLTIGSTYPTVNGEIVPIDQPGIIIDGRTLVPLRFVAESLGANVDWDGSSQTVTITSNQMD